MYVVNQESNHLDSKAKGNTEENTILCDKRCQPAWDTEGSSKLKKQGNMLESWPGLRIKDLQQQVNGFSISPRTGQLLLCATWPSYQAEEDSDWIHTRQKYCPR